MSTKIELRNKEKQINKHTNKKKRDGKSEKTKKNELTKRCTKTKNEQLQRAPKNTKKRILEYTTDRYVANEHQRTKAEKTRSMNNKQAATVQRRAPKLNRRRIPGIHTTDRSEANGQKTKKRKQVKTPAKQIPCRYVAATTWVDIAGGLRRGGKGGEVRSAWTSSYTSTSSSYKSYKQSTIDGGPYHESVIWNLLHTKIYIFQYTLVLITAVCSPVNTTP